MSRPRPFLGPVRLPPGVLEEIEPVQREGCTLRRFRFRGLEGGPVLTEVPDRLLSVGEVTPKPLEAPPGGIFGVAFRYGLPSGGPGAAEGE